MAVDHPAPVPTPEEVKQTLGRILKSDGFANSPRLQGFLRFIVEEQLAGRGNAIKGKIIATDVYDKTLDETGNAQNLVRVEARRLRRGLEEYYSGEGHADQIRVTLARGSYRPQFVRIADAAPNSPDGNQFRRRYLPRLPVKPRALSFASLALLLMLGAGAFLALGSQTVVRQNTATDAAELSALRERAMTSVQAVNLAQQARGLFFPLFDTRRQDITLASFRHVIDLDPGLPDGYAGAAQVLALNATLSTDPDVASAFLAEAMAMAERATNLDPTDGWAQAAHGWTLAVSGDFEGGLRRARIAAELDPLNGHTLDLVGLTALVAADAELMAAVSDPERPRMGSGRFAYNNIWGASQLMLENYDEVLWAFSTAAERGHPVSAPSFFLLATAHNEIGNTSEARQLIREMWDTWPEFPAVGVASRYFANDPMTLSRVVATIDAFSPD